MCKKILAIAVLLIMTSSLQAKKVSEEECQNMGENFIFAGGECIEYRAFEGESNDRIMIIVHGTWAEGTNTLGRYAPFAEAMNINTDLTTIAVALPGYSNSSTNNFEALAHEGVKNLSSNKDYVIFLGNLVEGLKEKFEAEEVTYVGHSAAARMGASLSGLKPDLIQNIALAGGSYESKKEGENSVSFSDLIDNASKETRYLFVYGTNDKISKPEVTTSFFEVAKQKGLNAKLIKVEGAAHLDLDMTDTSVEAIIEMLEEE